MPETILIGNIEDEFPVGYASTQTEPEIVVRASLGRDRVVEDAAANGNDRGRSAVMVYIFDWYVGLRQSIGRPATGRMPLPPASIS